MSLRKLGRGAGQMARKPLALLVIGGFLAVVLLNGGLDLAGATIAAPAQESYVAGKFTGHVVLTSGYGASDRFVSSWYTEGRSESFAVIGSVVTSYDAMLYGYEYRLLVKCERGSGTPYYCTGDWHPYNTYAKNLSDPHITTRQSPYTMDTWPTHLIGPAVGALKAELWVKTDVGGFAGIGSRQEWVKAAQDGATVVSGLGTMAFKSDSNRYEEGETVDLKVTTGDGAWRLTLYDGSGAPKCGLKWGLGSALYFPSTGDRQESSTTTPKPPAGSTNSDGSTTSWTGSTLSPVPSSCSLAWGGSGTSAKAGARSGTVQYTIPKGAFVENGNNEWELRLDNAVVNQQVLKTFIVDMHEKAPEAPVVETTDKSGKSMDGREAEVGQKLIFTFESRSNPAAASPVAKFLVYIWHGDTSLMPSQSSNDWIANGVSVTAKHAGDGLYTGSYEYEVKRAAKVQSWAVAVDAQGRPSGSSITADQADQQEQGTDGTNGITDPNTDSETEVDVEGAEPSGAQEPEAKQTATVTLLVAIIGVLGSLVLWAFLPTKPPVKIAAMALLSIALLYYGGFFG